MQGRPGHLDGGDAATPEAAPRRRRGLVGPPPSAAAGPQGHASHITLDDRARDLPEHGLRAGDLGAVETKALVTLKAADVRSVGESDMLTVRTA
jgi:hypothetical protein